MSVHSSRGEDSKAVYFHPKQIEYLERVFPEIVFPSTATEAAIREHMGVRKVILFIKGKKNSDAG